MIDITDTVIKKLDKALAAIESGDLDLAKRRLKSVIKDFSDEPMVSKSRLVVFERRDVQNLVDVVDMLSREIQPFLD